MLPGADISHCKKVELIKTELVQKEGEIRKVPVNIPNSNYIIDIDYIVMALGSMPEEIVNSLDIKLNKWGYIDTAGKLAIKYQYEDARSFANGVAGYKDNGVWGVIDQNNDVILEPMFDDVKTMNSNGILIIKNGEIWQCIQLYAFMNYD